MYSTNISSSLNLTVTLDSNETGCEYTECIANNVLEAAEFLTIIFAVLGSLGNIMTVFAIITSNLKNNINSILIGNLSAAQIIYCSFILPLQAVVFHHRKWLLPNELCIVGSAIRTWLIGVNMMLLSGIALYRFLHIVQPQTYEKFSRRCQFIGVVVLCWLFPLGFSVTPIIGIWGSFSFQPAILQCTFTQSEEKSHKVTTITLGYVIPCIFIVVCYARIGFVAYTSRKRVTRTASQNRRQKAQKDSLRLTAMMLCIFCLFLIGTTPYFMVNILDSKYRKPLAHIWAPFMAWFMYCMNPVVYTVMDVNFQNAFRSLLCCEICSQRKQRGSIRVTSNHCDSIAR